MTKVIRVGLLVGVVLIVVACACVFTGFASDGTPEGLFSWYDPILGATCYVWPDGSGDCYCPCEGEECVVSSATKVPTTVATETVPAPTPTNTPFTPTPEPTDEPKVKCNRGLGNGSEGCDPGNSGGKPGAAGEDNE